MSKLLGWLEQKPVNAMQEVLEAHKMTGESVGGLLGKCMCGEAVDWNTQHWAEVLEREGFGDLKPARQLVADWRKRSLEILEKARYLESTGASVLSTQYRLIRSQAYNFMSIKLDQIVNEKHLKGN
jgi:hypothetical protein